MITVQNRVDRLYDIGTVPPVGTVPTRMYAWTIREERFGDPLNAFRVEVVDVPKPRRGEVIVCNYAAGINYNGVWAATGKPKNVIADHGKWGERAEPFFICGSESAGVVYEVGEGVDMFKVGDEVCVTGIQADYENCSLIKAGEDPMLSPSFRIWGYEANWGAFAQFSRVQQQQCYPKPESLTWEEAASCFATGGTVHRMLTMYPGNEIRPGDVVLIWGGSGGLGTMAIQLVNYYGGIPVAVVSDEERAEFCMKIGAKGCINRNRYSHFGLLTSEYRNPDVYRRWLREAVRFRREIYDIVGEKKDPRIVIEHPGESTLPTSLFVCARGGMVVLCGATTGYIGSLDLRFLWLHQKRLQGSHAGRREQCPELARIIEEGGFRPYLSRVFAWEELAEGHQMLYENRHAGGNMAVLIGASQKGLGRS